MKKIIAMVMALVFSVSMMAFAAEKKVVATTAAAVTTTAETAKAPVAKGLKVRKHKGKKAPAKPVETPVAAVK